MTLILRSLLLLPTYAVHLFLERHFRERFVVTMRILGIKIIVREREVLQIRQAANTLRHIASKLILRNVDNLQALHIFHPMRQVPYKPVPADIKNRGRVQQRDFFGQTSGQKIIRHDEFIQLASHHPDAARNAPDELIMRHHDHRNRGITQVFGYGRVKSIVVDEDGIQILVKQRRRQLAFEIIEPEIEELEVRQV